MTSPLVLAVATEGSLLAQVTAAFDMVLPFWSRTVAVSWAVSPSDTSIAEVGDTVTELGIEA
ncbi:MAG: hypothetical protein OXI83_19285 [Gemmatimonadota bacterium]|nr:hypothetical protein [Gemmatimonadota bacterium]